MGVLFTPVSLRAASVPSVFPWSRPGGSLVQADDGGCDPALALEPRQGAPGPSQRRSPLRSPRRPPFVQRGRRRAPDAENTE